MDNNTILSASICGFNYAISGDCTKVMLGHGFSQIDTDITAYFALIELSGKDIDLWQPVTRSQFESLIAGEKNRIETCVLDTKAIQTKVFSSVIAGLAVRAVGNNTN